MGNRVCTCESCRPVSPLERIILLALVAIPTIWIGILLWNELGK